MIPAMHTTDWVRHLQHVAAGPAELDTPAPTGLLGASGSGVDRDLLSWRQAERGGPWADLVEAGEGPLRAWPGDQAIEVWTEIELASMHALWRLARRSGDAMLQGRLFHAARWHVQNTQPDNATNRPWAIHVFLIEGSADGRAYAATLLHNAQAVRAVIEPGSAWILLDAAAELQAAARASR